MTHCKMGKIPCCLSLFKEVLRGVLINTGQMYSILKGFTVKLAEHQKAVGGQKFILGIILCH